VLRASWLATTTLSDLPDGTGCCSVSPGVRYTSPPADPASTRPESVGRELILDTTVVDKYVYVVHCSTVIRSGLHRRVRQIQHPASHLSAVCPVPIRMSGTFVYHWRRLAELIACQTM